MSDAPRLPTHEIELLARLADVVHVYGVDIPLNDEHEAVLAAVVALMDEIEAFLDRRGA